MGKINSISLKGSDIRKVLSGSKTQYRILMDPQPKRLPGQDEAIKARDFVSALDAIIKSGLTTIKKNTNGNVFPDNPCDIGDILWIRERFRSYLPFIDGKRSDILTVEYEADGGHKPMYRVDKNGEIMLNLDGEKRLVQWQSYSNMPKEFSRISIKIKDIRIERIQDISEEDAIAEGINRISHGMEGFYYHYRNVGKSPNNYCCPIDAFKKYWEGKSGVKSWNNNLWVFVLEFEKI